MQFSGIWFNFTRVVIPQVKRSFFSKTEIGEDIAEITYYGLYRYL